MPEGRLHEDVRALPAVAASACMEQGTTTSIDRHLTAVSVVIVNFNAGDMLDAAVESALSTTGAAVDVVVVDNASTDTSLDIVRTKAIASANLKVIVNDQNTGFARACNIGTNAVSGAWVLYLNPDCVIAPLAIQKMLEAAAFRDDVGMVGGFLMNPDGSEQVGGRRAVPTPWRSLVRVLNLGRKLGSIYPRLFSDFLLHTEPLPTLPIEVEAISGACMLVRRSALEKVGMLDERYFLHCEDLDWCMRFREAGLKILFVPSAKVTHHKGRCSADRPVFVEWHKHRGMIRFYRKFFRHQYPGALMLAVAATVWIRFAAKVVVIQSARARRSLFLQ
jgi:GT2 family glycosyltransferase